MRTKNEKRLWLLCGASLVALQLASGPVERACGHPVLIANAQAQEASCFVAGTLVLMADGTQRPIEAIKVGDLVLGRRGRSNRVRGCERTRLGRRRLYGLNGGRPFVTAEHPFLTAEGWKALDPDATRRETDGLAVAPLQLGDRLCRGTARQAGADPGREALVYLQSVTVLEAVVGTTGASSTPLFNLLLDGDHSYVADGWIVHNKSADGAGSDGGGGGGSDGGGGGGSDGGGGGGSDGGGGGGSDGGGGGGSDGGGGGGSDGSGGGGSDGGGGGGSDGGSGGGNASGAGGPSTDGGAGAHTGSQADDAGNADDPASGPATTGTSTERGTASSGSIGSTGARPTTGAQPRTSNAKSSRQGGKPAPSPPPSGPIDALLRAMGFRDSQDAGLAPTGPPLSVDQEKLAIQQGWRERR
ncbi:MAG: Hint domain-containing protein [Geminicoccaceae bacterium]